VNPLLKKLLIITIVIYVAASSYMQANLCERVTNLEHRMSHLTAAHTH
jgi:hypothetical protein